MSKSEHLIQDEIRLDLSQYGIILRLNSGKFWHGKKVWSNEYNQWVLINIRPIQGCPAGTPDLLFLGENNNVAFIECKDDKGTIREKQEKFINIMHRYGIRAGIARSTREALLIIGKESNDELEKN